MATLPPDPGYGLDLIEDAVGIIEEGKRIDEEGIPYLIEGIIPAVGMLGMQVAYAKVGKTTWSQQAAASIAMRRDFLGRPTEQRRVLVLAAEDPPEYTAWLTRVLDVDPGVMSFRRAPLQLDPDTLRRIAATIDEGHYGFVLISSWLNVINGLIQHENDNAAISRVIRAVKSVVHGSGTAWLIDAHAGKGEDQSDEADPTMALRGASTGGGDADYLLSLRYARSPFSTDRRLSGKGKFVNFAPFTIDMDTTNGLYHVPGTMGLPSLLDSVWILIERAGALTADPQSATQIARTCGLWDGTPKDRLTKTRLVRNALHLREGVLAVNVTVKGHKTTYYALGSGGLEPSRTIGEQ